jgi:hypothetical protein
VTLKRSVTQKSENDNDNGREGMYLPSGGGTVHRTSRPRSLRWSHIRDAEPAERSKVTGIIRTHT